MINDKFKRLWKGIAYAATGFVILEPLWMLTPLAGFLYGSVLNVDFLESSKATSWLLLFVFPPRRLIAIGLFLVVIGITVFLICAYKVYAAKAFKRGMVTTRIYRYLRHPQYTALIVAGAGFVILWGRFIAYLCLFIMIYLYYLLSKKEESICLSRYGEAYEEYRKRTTGIIPGTDFLERLLTKRTLATLSKPIATLCSFLLVICLALTSGFTILKAREACSGRLPVIQKEISFDDKKLPIIIPRIPYLDKDKPIISAFRKRDLSPDIFFQNIKSSKTIKDKLAAFCDVGMDMVLIIFEPRRGMIKEKSDTMVNFLMLPMDAGGPFTGIDTKDFRKKFEIKGLLKVKGMLMANGAEPIKWNIDVMTFRDLQEDDKLLNSIESKIDVLLSRFY
ncbi:MAG: isoprenylcysteine carboxylmethyltransferase family protein [Proteobacteria bacterium]|nr:isoprenylcysteine carboxylmethyltransferase family protein [Pseudomonadota bacterium]